MKNETGYIRIGEVAKTYGISRWKILRLEKEGRITVHRLGHRTSLVKVADLKDLIEGR